MEVDSQDISSDRVVVSIVETEGTRARPRTSFSKTVLLEIIVVVGSMGVTVGPTVESVGAAVGLVVESMGVAVGLVIASTGVAVGPVDSLGVSSSV